MTDLNPKSLMYDLLSRRDKINELFLSLNPGIHFFEDISLNTPHFLPSELGFLRSVPYLYVLYKEVGRVNLDIALFNLDLYDPQKKELGEIHIELVDKLRTYLQHNLDPREKSRDQQTIDKCQSWFYEKCATKIPETEFHWVKCLNSLLQEAIEFLEAILFCLREIEKDESFVLIMEQWNVKRLREHKPHEFDSLISLVAADMGQDKIDSVSFRKRYYQKWSKYLRALTGDYVFENEARKLIEAALLQENLNLPPITGDHIMKAYNLPPGPQIRQLLDKVRELYNNGYSDEKTLLQKLGEYIQDS